MPKIKITKKPTRQFSGNFKGNEVPEMLGSHNYASEGTDPQFAVKKSLTAVPEHIANVEAEGGETAMFPDTSGFPGFPSFYDIKGNRHSNGGVNLALPDDAFIYSDTKDMKIKDKTILAMFGKSVGKKGKKQFTPAEISKKYDINEYLKVLADPNSSKIEVNTAEQMIKNYQAKLGQLALVQESTKGFPDGIPAVAVPYLYSVGVDPKAILGDNGQETQQQPSMKYGGGLDRSEDFGSEKNPYPSVDSSDFAGGGRSYPIPTVKDAQDALRLAHLHGRQDVISKVYTKYPELKKQYGGAQENMSIDTSQLPQLNTINNDFQLQDRAMMKQSGNLASMQQGGPVVDWTADENALALAIAEAQKSNPGKTVYVKRDGKYQTVKGNAYPGKTYTGKQDFGKAKKSFEQLSYLLENNPDVQNSVYENYLKHIKDSKNKRLTGAARERLLSVPKEEVIKNFLNYQEQVYTFDANKVDLSDPKDEYDTERNGKNGKYKALVNQFGLPQLSDDQIMMGQAFYKGFWDTKQDPQFKDELSHISMGQFGKKDEPKNYKDDISPVDGIFGNTTAGQYVSTAGDFSLTDAEQKKEEGLKDYKNSDTQYDTQVSNPEWWQQDVNNTSLALKNQLGLKKYYPKLQTLNLQEPSPVFKSPEREAAAIAEQANIAQQANASFSGAQNTSARNSQVQGTAANQVANALGQTHNYNIGIANQFEQLQKQIRNQEEMGNAQNASQFYDQTVRTNQNYDDSKRQAEAVTLSAFNQGLTNSQKTAALNAMYPHFQTNAPTGSVYFNKGSKLDPSLHNQNPAGLDSYLQKMYELGMQPDPKAVGSFYTGFNDQNYNDITDNGYGTGDVGYPGSYQKFGGELKRIRIKKLPK